MRMSIACNTLGLLAIHSLMSEAGAEGGASGASAPATTGTVIRPDTGHYVKVKSASGATSKACGDETSLLLAGATLDETYPFVAKVTGQEESVLREKYGTKNPGQQRMFLGNLIRGGLASKDEKKVATIQAGLSEHQVAFRQGVDARIQADEKVLNQRRDEAAKVKAEAKEKREAELKAKREAEAKERADKKAAEDKVKAEAKAKREAEAKEKREAEAKAKADAKAAAAAAKAKPAKSAE